MKNQQKNIQKPIKSKSPKKQTQLNQNISISDDKLVKSNEQQQHKYDLISNKLEDLFKSIPSIQKHTKTNINYQPIYWSDNTKSTKPKQSYNQSLYKLRTKTKFNNSQTNSLNASQDYSDSNLSSTNRTNISTSKKTKNKTKINNTKSATNSQSRITNNKQTPNQSLSITKQQKQPQEQLIIQKQLVKIKQKSPSNEIKTTNQKAKSKSQSPIPNQTAKTIKSSPLIINKSSNQKNQIKQVIPTNNKTNSDNTKQIKQNINNNNNNDYPQGWNDNNIQNSLLSEVESDKPNQNYFIEYVSKEIKIQKNTKDTTPPQKPQQQQQQEQQETQNNIQPKNIDNNNNNSKLANVNSSIVNGHQQKHENIQQNEKNNKTNQNKTANSYEKSELDMLASYDLYNYFKTRKKNAKYIQQIQKKRQNSPKKNTVQNYFFNH